VPKAAYWNIREIAVANDQKRHYVIMRGIDRVLGEHSFPGIAELKNGKA